MLTKSELWRNGDSSIHFCRIMVNLNVTESSRDKAGDESGARRIWTYVEPLMRKPNAVAGRLCYIEVNSRSSYDIQLPQEFNNLVQTLTI